MSRSRSQVLRGRLALLVAGVMVLLGLLSVNWFPIVLPDSLQYLAHAQDLSGDGLVQAGFRQVGYPLWIAAVGTVGGWIGLQPLQAVVAAQYLLAIASIGASITALRWWATPIVLVLTLPTAASYSNFLLTEAIAVPIAVLGATGLAGAYWQRPKTPWRSPWVLLSASVATILPIIRLHYGLITIAIIVGIILLPGSASTMRQRLTIPAMVMGIVALFAVGLAVENHAENGIASPSLGAERALFWVLWETVVVDHRDTVADELPDIYRDGTPDALLLSIDGSPMTYRAQRQAYADAVESILSVTGSSMSAQRVASTAGVIFGARLDDLGPVLLYSARDDVGDQPRDINQYGAVRPVDPRWLADEYNGGAEATALWSSADRVPLPPRPYLGVVMTLLIPVVTVIALYLLRFSQSRRLALTGVIATLGYALASFAFVFDNLRYLLPAYMFSIAVVSGAARLHFEDGAPSGNQKQIEASTAR